MGDGVSGRGVEREGHWAVTRAAAWAAPWAAPWAASTARVAAVALACTFAGARVLPAQQTAAPAAPSTGAAAPTMHARPPHTCRVCADPDNMPFADD